MPLLEPVAAEESAAREKPSVASDVPAAVFLTPRQRRRSSRSVSMQLPGTPVDFHRYTEIDREVARGSQTRIATTAWIFRRTEGLVVGIRQLPQSCEPYSIIMTAKM